MYAEAASSRAVFAFASLSARSEVFVDVLDVDVLPEVSDVSEEPVTVIVPEDFALS